MGQKMKNAPVYFTIAQVRHNPVLSLEAYISGIQESFRKAGYPDFKKAISMAFNLTPTINNDNLQTQPLPMQQVERYIFSNMDSMRGFILQQNALSYQATEYGTFELFSSEFLKGLKIVHDSVTIDFSERIGVRYLDAVIPKPEESLKQYLVPGVMGLSSDLQNNVLIHSFTETLMQVPNIGQVIARTIIQNGAVGFPPDLQPDSLKLAERFTTANQLHAVIDTDGSFEGREAFDMQVIENRLDNLHKEISKAFRTMTTDYARKSWN